MVFTYDSLPHARYIRLLRVSWNPAQEGVLQGEFCVVPIDDLPCEYLAISYMWGSSEKTDVVQFNGQDIKITASAMSVLSNMASERSSKYIWIDGLCINQDDDVEKASQVLLMRDIYSKAKSVIAWLGVPTPVYEAALDFVVTLHHGIIETTNTTTLVMNREAFDRLPACKHPSYGWSALSRLLQHPYFQRSWILQEMVLASEVVIPWKKKMLPWPVLAEALWVLHVNGMSAMFTQRKDGEALRMPQGVNCLRLALGLRHHREAGILPSMSALLMECSTFEATDPRDKIFALLGMTSELDDPDLQPDYQITTVEVFQKVAAILLIRESSSASILYAAGIGSTCSVSKGPSWVPDWSCVPVRTIFGAVASTANYRASSSTLPAGSVRFDKETSTIIVSAIIVDDVAAMAAPYVTALWRSSRDQARDDICVRLKWLDDLRKLWSHAEHHPTGLPFWPDVIWRTLIADSLMGQPAPEAYAQHFQDFFEYYKLVVAYPGGPDDEGYPPDEIANSCEKYTHAMSYAVNERRPFGTKRGYIGIGPTKIEKNDKVCVFLGFPVPFIVRPREAEGYLLVGECYVYGLMAGEALLDGTMEDITLY